MSANRLLKRNQWRKTMKDEDVKAPFHDFMLATGQRDESFQKNVRRERARCGLPLTSSDMSRVHGRRVA